MKPPRQRSAQTRTTASAIRKPSKPARSSRDKVRAHRARLRKRGLRLVQMWLPDTRSARFARQAHKDSLLIARSESEAEDQAWVDSLSWWNSPEARALDDRELAPEKWWRSPKKTRT